MSFEGEISLNASADAKKVLELQSLWLSMYASQDQRSQVYYDISGKYDLHGNMLRCSDIM